MNTTTTQTRPPSPGAVGEEETGQLISSDKVEGTAVYDSEGERVGTVRQVMIGKLDGQVRYVVMGMGGMFGFGEDDFPLPWDGLDYDTTLEGYKLKGVTSEDFKRDKAPSYARDQEPDWSEDYDRSVRAYYLRSA